MVQSVLCDPGAQDFLHIELSDGRNLSARLDGCGHRLGEVLAVEVPDPLPTGELVVRLSGTGVRTASADGQRLAAVGVTVAGVAGALLMWRLRGSSLVRRRVGA